MYPRRDDRSGLYGYWARGGWAIAPRFDYAFTFSHGYAAVRFADKRPGLIAADGTPRDLKAICGGRTPIRTKLSSFTGFDDCDPKPSRYASIRTRKRWRRQWGIIDEGLTYKPLPDRVFAGADIVQTHGEYVVLYRSGRRPGEARGGLFNLADMRLELPVEYACIYPSEGPIWAVARHGDADSSSLRFAFYDLRQHAFLPGWYWGATSFQCGFGAIHEEGRGSSYFVDEDLKPVFDAKYDHVDRFSHGLAAVYKGDEAGYIDTTGRMRLLLPYEEMRPYNEHGLAIANRDDVEWDIDIIDRRGRPRLSGLETAVYWDGDFPHYEVTERGEEHLYDVDLSLIY